MELKYGIIPDPLDSKTTRICSAPITEDQFLEGLEVERDKCTFVYNDSTRKKVLDQWIKLPYECFHLSGGWRNPMTAEFKFFRNKPGNVPFKDRAVEEYEENLPIEFDYINNWLEMVKAKGISEEEFRKMKISDLLSLGAPPYWDLKAEGKVIARSTSAPFPGTQLAMGYIVIEKEPEFKEGKFPGVLSNTTGARGFDTTAMNHLLTALVHPEKKIEEIYIKEAEWRNEESKKKKGKELPYARKIDEYAASFVDSVGPVKDEAIEILKKYGEIDGFQYAAITYTIDQTPAGIFKFPDSVKHAYVKEDGKWLKAEI